MIKLPFDEIVCLNLAERKDRKQFMQRQFDHLGISDLICWHEAVKHPHGQLIAESLRKSGKGYIKGPHEYSCAREHYTILKKAYLNGLNNILILEDDISILSDIASLKRLINNIPDDYNILRCCAAWDCDHIQRSSTLGPDDLWNLDYHSFWGTGGYAVNRDGMKYILDYQDEYFVQADMPLYDTRRLKKMGIKIYTSKYPVAIYKDDEISVSDVQPVKSDTNILKDTNYNCLPLNYNIYGCM